jgi:hypothetical protein
MWALRVERNYRLLAAALFAMGLAGGCAGARCRTALPTAPPHAASPWSRLVLIDDTFAKDEIPEIVVGCDAWAVRLGARTVDLRYRLVSHGLAEEPSPPGELHIARRATVEEIAPDCSGMAAVGCYRFGEDRIMLAATAISLRDIGQVTSHELGHAMGLPDRPDRDAGRSVMVHVVENAAPTPTALDVADFCKQHVCEESQ